MESVYCINNDTVISVGEAGVILRTINGGQNWNQLSSGTSEILNEVFFCNNTDGYIVGRNGTVLKSSDAGATWVNLNFPNSYHISSCNFFNKDTGWVATEYPGTVYKTVNGGSSWDSIYHVSSFYDIYFIDSDTGFVVSFTEFVYRTTDGGENWSAINVGAYMGLQGIYFANKQIGYVCGGSNLYKTTDSGITWTEITTSYNYLFNLHFPTLMTGYCAGTNEMPVYGGIAKTTDGGQTWVGEDWLRAKDVYFVHADTGYVVTRDGEIFKTTNGSIYKEDVAVNELTPDIENINIYPNPTSKDVTIAITLKESLNITIDVYSLTGKKVCSLAKNQLFNKGNNEVRWNLKSDDGNPVDSGIYIYHIKSIEFEKAGKITIFE
ncbi:MAG: T9SS type A sorting domain-containing protein [Bacteroidales bacterium]|nr:T9SS type A sorting domain-containing protein [Bacteroidales bacterium]